MGDVTPGRHRRGPGALELGLSVLAGLALFALSLVVPFVTLANATRRDYLAAYAQGATIATVVLALVVGRAVVVGHPGYRLWLALLALGCVASLALNASAALRMW